MSKLITRYNDWSKGDAGWLDKMKVAPGFFLGENVVAYRDGSIGPRSGFLSLAPTGGPGGTPFDLGYVDLGTSGIEYVWMRKGTALVRVAVYDASAFVLTGQAWNAATGAFATANFGDHVDYDPRITLFTVRTDKCYKCDWSAGANGTLTAIAGSPGGFAMEIFGDYLVVANTVGHTNRLTFSAQQDYTSWPAANFIDIGAIGNIAGDTVSITALRRVRDQLLAFTDTGQLYVITGNLQDHPVIREYMHGDAMSGPGFPRCVVRARDGSVWWTRREEMTNTLDQLWVGPSVMPVSYLGGVRSDVPLAGGYLHQTAFGSSRSSLSAGVTGRSDKSVVLFDPANVRHLMLRDGAWSKHAAVTSGNDHNFVAAGSRGEVFMLNSGGTLLHAWQFEMERPPWKFSGSAAEHLPYTVDDSGNPYTVGPWFATPVYQSPDFQAIQVELIEVLFTSHYTKDSVNNHLEVFLQQFNVPNASEKINWSAAPANKDDVAGAMAAGGVTVGMDAVFDEAPDPSFDFRRRVTFFPKGGAPRPAPSIRVVCDFMRGVSVQEVLVFGEMESVTRP